MHRHRRRASDRQPDLFLLPRPPSASGSPGWCTLPEATRQALTALMTRLLIAHAAAPAPGADGDADER
jgi:hypothetical protein